MKHSHRYPKKQIQAVTAAAVALADLLCVSITSHGKITAELKDVEAPKTATVTIKFFHDIGRRLWNWMVLRMWMKRVMEKKKHQVDMQKAWKLWWVSEMSLESNEETRLKVAQLEMISNVRIKKKGLVKSRVSRTITGMVPSKQKFQL